MANPWYVIGGGLIGLLCARELRQAGEQVVVLDRQAVGRAASWAGGGILSPLYPWRYPDPVNILAAWSQEFYPHLTESLRRSTGIDPEWTRSGMIILGEADAKEALTWGKKSGKHVERLTSDQVSSTEPELATVATSAAHIADVAQLRNPRILSALHAELLRNGVEFREYSPVSAIIVRSGKIAALVLDGVELATSRCLVAGGAWTADLLTSAGVQLPIHPVRGQMILYRPERRLLSHIVLKDYHYLIPRRDGHLLVGSTFEEVGFDSSTTEPARRQLQAAAVELLPALGREVILRQWAGLRPGSPGGVPLIGEHPNISGLFVCAGHFRNGIVTGPASARLAADLMLKRDPSFDPAPYAMT